MRKPGKKPFSLALAVLILLALLPVGATASETDLAASIRPGEFFGVIGETARFTAEAEGGAEPYTYAWYIKNPNSAKFSRSGVTGASYSVALTETNSGRQLYCIVTDAYGNTAQTNTVSMTAAEPLAITAALTDYAGLEGSTASFTVQATGVGLTYQWWVKKPTATRFSKSSVTGDTYAVELTEARNGNQIYCVVTDAFGNTARTNTVSMTAAEPLAIISVPGDYTGPIGSIASFTVEASGTGLSYQWYVKKPTATKFSKSSITGDTYAVELTEARNGNQLYCVVTDAFGNAVRTNTVTMTVG